jgi:hypothetical protein
VRITHRTVRGARFYRENTVFHRGFTVKTAVFAFPCNYGFLKGLAVLHGKCARTSRASTVIERTYAIVTVFHGGSVANKGVLEI